MVCSSGPSTGLMLVLMVGKHHRVHPCGAPRRKALLGRIQRRTSDALTPTDRPYRETVEVVTPSVPARVPSVVAGIPNWPAGLLAELVPVRFSLSSLALANYTR